ncbi:hypothetical protein GA0115240_11154 [Streptomyces sp. DvalAA-14]|uniref:hypothetical protein n=1 Tax=unclassified Streptomyces TaxID=2593676 RepID=UPI00081BAD5A|nr:MULTISPECIES: hypothetical protein [unclassified Streptomyces]SCD50148.1 hypothetical protein GA0115240_11154 [Streptomyces sp. DvalAA-14]
MTIAGPNVTEAYAFACLNCGYGWEQSYEIEHHTDTYGHPFVRYLVDGVKVPSPLTCPTCQNCDGHLVRIMRSGQVAGSSGASSEATEAFGRRAAARRAERPAPRRVWWRSLRGFPHRRQGGAEPA